MSASVRPRAVLSSASIKLTGRQLDAEHPQRTYSHRPRKVCIVQAKAMARSKGAVRDGIARYGVSRTEQEQEALRRLELRAQDKATSLALLTKTTRFAAKISAKSTIILRREIRGGKA